MCSLVAIPFIVFAVICTYFNVQNGAEHLVLSSAIAIIIAAALIITDVACFLMSKFKN